MPSDNHDLALALVRILTAKRTMPSNIEKFIPPHAARAAKYLHKARKHADRATNPTLSAAQAGASRNSVLKYIQKLKGELSGTAYFKLNVKEVANQLIQRPAERNTAPRLTIKIPAKQKRASVSPHASPSSTTRNRSTASHIAGSNVDTATYRNTPVQSNTILGTVVAPRYRGHYQHSGTQVDLAVQDAAEALEGFKFGGESALELDDLTAAMQATSLGQLTSVARNPGDFTHAAKAAFHPSPMIASQDSSPASSLSSLPDNHAIDATAELFGNMGIPLAPKTTVQDIHDRTASGPQRVDWVLQSFDRCELDGWPPKEVRRADRQTQAAPYNKAARPARFTQLRA